MAIRPRNIESGGCGHPFNIGRRYFSFRLVSWHGVSLTSRVGMARDLPWMAINNEIRAARSFAATQIVTTDYSSVHLTQENIPALCRLKDDFLDLIKKCQAESFSEELRRLQKKKSLYSTSSVLALVPIISEDGLLRLGGRAGKPNYLMTSYTHLSSLVSILWRRKS
jgi:hypothetical protein